MARSKRRTAEEWAELIQAQGGSGQTAASFCDTHQIKKASFYYWRAKLREEEKDTDGFVALHPQSGAASSIIIRCVGGLELELPADYSPSALIELIQNLRC